MNKTNMKKLKMFPPGYWRANRWTMDRILLRLEHSFLVGPEATNEERARRINRLLRFEAVRWSGYKFWFTSRFYTELNRLDEGVK